LVRYLAALSLVVMLAAAPALAQQAVNTGLEAPALGAKSASATPKPAPKKPEPVTVRVGRVGAVQVASAPIFMTRSSRSTKYTTVKAETAVAVVKEEGDWYGVLMANGSVGWIKRFNVKMTGYELVAKKPQPDRGSSTSRGGQPARGVPDTGEGIVHTALQYSGVPYIYGGVDPATGMDCSAFVRMVFGQYGTYLPRTAREQALVGATVPFDQLQPGDRLYFCCKNTYVDHCGIYAGNGYFVHCSAGRNGVGIDTLTSDYYWRSLVVAKRS